MNETQQQELLSIVKEVYTLAGGAYGDPVIYEALYTRMEIIIKETSKSND